jgi:serine/threonine protein phosphatase 1
MNKYRRIAIGDIHGCFRTFRKIVEEILRPEKEDILFLLGDYIDRGPKSKDVIDYIISLRENSYDIRPVMGNHEFMLLRSLEDPEYFRLWTWNGCAATLESFGVDPLMTGERESVFRIPDPYVAFCRSLPLYEETEGFLMVHAGLPAGAGKPEEDIQSLLWTRSEAVNRQILGQRRLIHGHTPVTLEAIRERVKNPDARVINLDGGCVYRGNSFLGNLVALDLETFHLFHLPDEDE